MFSSQTRSIRSRLSLGFLKTTGVSLSVAMVLFVSIEFTRSQNAMTRNLSVLSAVIGMNTAPALLFDDPTAAEETLSAFTAESHVTAAIIYDADGDVFARYSRADVDGFEAPPVRHDQIEFDWFGDRLDLYQTIDVDGDDLGTVFIRSDTREVRALILRAAAAAVGIMLLASLVAWFGAAQLQEEIATPLAALVEGSEAMSRGDLAIRVDLPPAPLVHRHKSLGGLPRGRHGQTCCPVNRPGTRRASCRLPMAPNRFVPIRRSLTKH